MARTRGSLNWKTKQKYLHDKFPDQGWMEESDKRVIDKHYKALKDVSVAAGGAAGKVAQGIVTDVLVAQTEEMGLYK